MSMLVGIQAGCHDDVRKTIRKTYCHGRDKCITFYFNFVYVTYLFILTRSDKIVPRCQCGHPELLTPAESAINELWFDMRFKTVRNARVKLWPLKVIKVAVQWNSSRMSWRRPKNNWKTYCQGRDKCITFIIILYVTYLYILTRSDKMAPRCQDGHPELLTPAESAIKEL